MTNDKKETMIFLKKCLFGIVSEIFQNCYLHIFKIYIKVRNSNINNIFNMNRLFIFIFACPCTHMLCFEIYN